MSTYQFVVYKCSASQFLLIVCLLMNNIYYWHDFWVVSEILDWLLYMCVALWRSAYCALSVATPWTTWPSGQALDIARIDQNGYSIESVVQVETHVHHTDLCCNTVALAVGYLL